MAKDDKQPEETTPESADIAPQPVSTGSDTHPNAYLAELEEAITKAHSALGEVDAKAHAYATKLQNS